MLSVSFHCQNKSELTILCLGAHSDDIEIGCGGTILRLIEEFPSAHIVWVVFGAHGARKDEARNSANAFLKGAGKSEILIKEFQDGYFPYIGVEIKVFFEQIKSKYSPDIILTHYRADLHQDHRLVSDLTWNTFRNHMILEYEIIKYDGDIGNPNYFVHLPERIVRKKIGTIINSFNSQTAKQWFTEDAFLSVLRLRGIESNAPEKFAEAFYCRKIVF